MSCWGRCKGGIHIKLLHFLKNTKLLLGLFILELVILVFFFYLPLSANMEAELSQQQSLQEHINELKATKESEQGAVNPAVALPKQMDSEDFLARLDQSAKSHQLRIIQVTQGSLRKIGDMDSLDINIVLEGSKENIVLFIKAIEEQERLAKLSTWQLSPQGNQYSLNCKINIYALP